MYPIQVFFIENKLLNVLKTTLLYELICFSPSDKMEFSCIWEEGSSSTEYIQVLPKLSKWHEGFLVVSVLHSDLL